MVGTTDNLGISGVKDGGGIGEPADAFTIGELDGEGAITTGGINSCSFTKKTHEGVKFAISNAGTSTGPPPM